MFNICADILIFLFVISIKYDFKYLLSTYYSLKLNCRLGVHLPRFYTN